MNLIAGVLPIAYNSTAFILLIVMLIAGILLIVKGGDYFVSAAAWMAEASGIPKFIVGATIVSVATTLPELLVSIIATANGNVAIATGNAIGSVVANTGLIMSLSLIFMPVIVNKKDYLGKGLLLITVASVLACLSLDGHISTVDAVVMIALFVVFIWENISSAKRNAMLTKEENSDKPQTSSKELWKNVALFLAGMIGIVVGSDLLAGSAEEVAARLGVPDSIIAITVVAIGTSLPELVTTITAIAKKESALSVGNVIGANIIDTALIMPICAFVSGGSLTVPTSTIWLDIPFALVLAIIMIVPMLIRGKFDRWQGILSAVIYATYLTLSCVLI